MGNTEGTTLTERQRYWLEQGKRSNYGVLRAMHYLMRGYFPGPIDRKRPIRALRSASFIRW